MSTCQIDWPQAWRVVAFRYPPINLFERLTDDTTVWDALIALEELTNPRGRDEVGDIALVPPDERLSGPGASTVMAAFTHVNPKDSRFSDGRFGVYCAAAALETAILKTVFHFEAFALDSADSPHGELLFSRPTRTPCPKPVQKRFGRPAPTASPIQASAMPLATASAPSAHVPSASRIRNAI